MRRAVYATKLCIRQGLAWSGLALYEQLLTLYERLMIVRPRPAYFALAFVMRGSVLPKIALRLVVILAVSCLAVWLHQLWPKQLGVHNPGPFTLLGLGLSIFLGFRNNACYDRWWEGRKQWGALVAISRNMLRDIMALLPEADPFRRQAAQAVGGFARRLRDQLRGTSSETPADWQPEAGWAPGLHNKSGWLLQAMAEEFARRMRQGEITDITYRLFSDHLGQMADVQAACERLHSTPVPFAYSLMLHRSVWLFCLVLPFGIVDVLGFGTPFITLVLAYSFLGLDALGEELEVPFSTQLNSLPLDAMTRIIEIAVAEALQESAPPPLQPQDYVLL